MYYTKCQQSAHYKNINNTKLDKSIVYKYKFWQRQSLFGTSTFSEDMGLQLVSLVDCEWIWSLKHITSSRNRFGITAFQFSSVSLHRRCHLQLLNGI